jgi:hypothetical protein
MNWNINKFNNNKNKIKISGDDRLKKIKIGGIYDLIITIPEIQNVRRWTDADGTYFKSVYCWDADGEPNTPEIDQYAWLHFTIIVQSCNRLDKTNSSNFCWYRK